jgi:hypothetical protein
MSSIILPEQKKIISQSQFAMATLMLKGKPFGFGLHGPFKDIYDWPKKEYFLKQQDRWENQLFCLHLHSRTLQEIHTREHFMHQHQKNKPGSLQGLN